MTRILAAIALPLCWAPSAHAQEAQTMADLPARLVLEGVSRVGHAAGQFNRGWSAGPVVEGLEGIDVHHGGGRLG